MRPGESFIGQPIRSLQTMLRFIGKNDENVSTLIPDGIYGPETLRAVSAFQRFHGLPVTGVTDLPTWEAIVALYEPALVEQAPAQSIEIILNPGQILRKGQESPHLYLVQSILKVLAQVYGSLTDLQVTGILDDATEDALFAFQQLHGLPATGALDKATWKALALQYPLASGIMEEKIPGSSAFG